jgi:hypothetical protein
MYATIIPGKDERGSPKLTTQGTQVEVAPGIVLHGVIGITLDAQVGGMWRAYVECNVRVQPIKARISIRTPRPARYYRRGGRAIWRK